MDQKYYNISYAESPFGTLNQYMTRTYGWMAAGLLEPLQRHCLPLPPRCLS